MLWPVGAIPVEGANLSIDGFRVVRGSPLDCVLEGGVAALRRDYTPDGAYH